MNYANLPKSPYPSETIGIHVSPIEDAISRLGKAIDVLMENADILHVSLASVLVAAPNYGESSATGPQIEKQVTCPLGEQLTILAYRMDSANKFLTEIRARIQL